MKVRKTTSAPRTAAAMAMPAIAPPGRWPPEQLPWGQLEGLVLGVFVEDEVLRLVRVVVMVGVLAEAVGESVAAPGGGLVTTEPADMILCRPRAPNG